MTNSAGQTELQSVGFQVARVIGCIVLGFFFLFFVAYGVVYGRVYGLVSEIARSFYWVHSVLAVTVATTAALTISVPLLWALFRVAVARADLFEHLIVATSIAVSLATAYVYRHKYFRAGNDALAICAPVLPDDAASTEHVGEGETEGRRCTLLTPNNSAVARAIDRQKAPKLIAVSSVSQMHELVWFKNGTPAIYIGNLEGPDGLPKLYDGPGFDPDTPEFLIPVSVEIINQLRIKQQRRDERQAAADRVALERRRNEAEEQTKKQEIERQLALEQERAEKERTQAEAARAEEMQRRREMQARADQEERQQAIRVEQERRDRAMQLAQERRENRLRVVAQSRHRINMEGRAGFAIPPGYWVTEYGSSIYFMLGERRIDTPNLSLFKQYDGQILAVPQPPQFIFRQANSDWIVIQMMPD